ncbi:hypothetical protein BV898_03897 [Hypsibius exemplaris]|uniref:Receptor ligand binding region domain-containing protein n=1 Tax=Hypsibius exemplaris TaxID=2072580 RepID=A0A1W0X3R8_HYPEX|nr:hypothetical protein BV898_03897 [Hypsibius exemplaris]
MAPAKPTGKSFLCHFFELFEILTFVSSTTSTLSPAKWLLDVEIVSPTYVGTASMTSLNYMLPAFTTGLEALQKSFPQLNITHTFLTDPNANDCNSHVATITDVLAHWYYRERRETAIPVIMATSTYSGVVSVKRKTSPLSCYTESTTYPLASAWKVLWLNSIGPDDAQRKRLLPQTWICTSPIVANFGELYLKILRHYNWTNLNIISDPRASGKYPVAATVTAKRLISEGFSVTVRNMPNLQRDMNELLSLVKTTSRVVIVFGDAFALRRLLIAASINGMTTQEYVYIATRIFIHKLYGSFTWKLQGRPPDEDIIMRLAFQSVLLVDYFYQDDETAAKVDRIAVKWNEISVKTNSTGGDDLPTPYLVATHASFSLLGKILERINNDSSCINDPNRNSCHAELPASWFFDKKFHLDTGITTINSMGSQLTTTSMSYFNNGTGQHEAFLVASETMDASFRLEFPKSIRWYGGGSLPPNEPLCGYRGFACHPTTGIPLQTVVISAAAGCIAVCLFIVVAWIRILVPRLEQVWQPLDWKEISYASKANATPRNSHNSFYVF